MRIKGENYWTHSETHLPKISFNLSYPPNHKSMYIYFMILPKNLWFRRISQIDFCKILNKFIEDGQFYQYPSDPTGTGESWPGHVSCHLSHLTLGGQEAACRYVVQVKFLPVWSSEILHFRLAVSFMDGILDDLRYHSWRVFLLFVLIDAFWRYLMLF